MVMFISESKRRRVKMIPNLKLYIYAALVIAIAGGGYWFNGVLNERADLKTKLKASELSRDTAIAGGIQYQQNNERQVKLISDYQVKLDEKQSKVNSDERDSNSGIKRVYVKASCPAASTVATNPATIEANAELGAIARADYFSLKRGIIKLEENYALCLQILNEDRIKAPLAY